MSSEKTLHTQCSCWSLCLSGHGVEIRNKGWRAGFLYFRLLAGRNGVAAPGRRGRCPCRDGTVGVEGELRGEATWRCSEADRGQKNALPD